VKECSRFSISPTRGGRRACALCMDHKVARQARDARRTDPTRIGPLQRDPPYVSSGAADTSRRRGAALVPHRGQAREPGLLVGVGSPSRDEVHPAWSRRSAGRPSAARALPWRAGNSPSGARRCEATCPWSRRSERGGLLQLRGRYEIGRTEVVARRVGDEGDGGGPADRHEDILPRPGLRGLRPASNLMLRNALRSSR